MPHSFFYHPDWPVLYEDNHLLVLYKPAGLLVQADQTGDISLLELGKAWIKERFGKPGNVFLGLVHRLDRPVAGVILFCRTSKAAGRLSSQFRSHHTRKKYLAVLQGELEQKSGRLVHLMERREDRSSRIVHAPGPGIQEARLTFTLLAVAESRSLVEISLETGRRHQIRLQFAHIGHPVIGDLRYGAPSPLPEGQIALLARELTVEHPTSREVLTFTSPLPRGWPWPPGMPPLEGPPWNWSDLLPSVCPATSASNPCSFTRIVEE